jgi:TonB family protein
LRTHRPRPLLAGALLFWAGTSTAHGQPVSQSLPGLTAPVLLERVEPTYPETAREAGIGGVVGLEITIEADGTVSAAKVIRAAGFGFDEAALEAVKRFKFKPATKDGQPIASTVLFDQEFKIRPHLVAQTSTDAEAPPPAPLPLPTSLPLAQTSSTASEYEVTVVARGPTSAASASSIRNLDFDLRPKTSPNDILRVVPGLLAVQHQGGGKADQLFLRGFDADHGTDVGVFIDGIPVNLPSHAHGQGFADLHWLVPEAVERIDVVKGPYDVRFGDFSTAGAVNLITRERFLESSVQYTLGSFPTIGGRETATSRVVGIAAPHEESDSRLHTWLAFEGASDDGPFEHREKLGRYNVFGKVSYDVTPHLTIGSFLEAYSGAWVGSGQIPQREVAGGRLGQFGSEDPSEGGMTQRQMFTGFLRYKDGADQLTITTYATRYRLTLFNDFTFFLQDPVNGDEIEQDDSRTFTGARIQYDTEKSVGGISFRTTAGSEIRYDGVHVDRWNAESQNGDFRKRLSRRVDDTQFGFSGANDDIDQTNLAAYFDEDIVFNEYLRVLAGARADYFGMNVNDGSEILGAGQQPSSGVRQFSVFSPKASVVLTPIPSFLDIYLNAGEGFHTNMAQIALIDGRSITNPDGSTFTVHAVPKFYGAELGVRTHLFNTVDLAGALWWSRLENETVFDADNAAFVPSDPTQRLGFDFEGRARILPWLYADLDLAFANAEAVPDGGNGGAVALAPRFYATGGLTAKHPSGLRAGLRFRALGDRPAFAATSPEYTYFTSKTLPDGRPNPDYDPSRVTAQGYLILDAYLAYRWELDTPLLRAVEASVSGQNLLNSMWREAQFGNRSCTYDETYNPANPNYSGPGNKLSDGTFANRCGIGYAVDPKAGGQNTRSGVVDIHYTPGVPLNLQFTAKAYF